MQFNVIFLTSAKVSETGYSNFRLPHFDQGFYPEEGVKIPPREYFSRLGNFLGTHTTKPPPSGGGFNLKSSPELVRCY